MFNLRRQDSLKKTSDVLKQLLIQKGKDFPGNFHTKKACGIRRESADQSRTNSSEHRCEAFLFHQLGIHVHDSCVSSFWCRLFRRKIEPRITEQVIDWDLWSSAQKAKYALLHWHHWIAYLVSRLQDISRNRHSPAGHPCETCVMFYAERKDNKIVSENDLTMCFVLILHRATV